jgi:hypothetical protein
MVLINSIYKRDWKAPHLFSENALLKRELCVNFGCAFKTFRMRFENNPNTQYIGCKKVRLSLFVFFIN